MGMERYIWLQAELDRILDYLNRDNTVCLLRIKDLSWLVNQMSDTEKELGILPDFIHTQYCGEVREFSIRRYNADHQMLTGDDGSIQHWLDEPNRKQSIEKLRTSQIPLAYEIRHRFGDKQAIAEFCLNFDEALKYPWVTDQLETWRREIGFLSRSHPTLDSVRAESKRRLNQVLEAYKRKGKQGRMTEAWRKNIEETLNCWEKMTIKIPEVKREHPRFKESGILLEAATRTRTALGLDKREESIIDDYQAMEGTEFRPGIKQLINGVKLKLYHDMAYRSKPLIFEHQVHPVLWRVLIKALIGECQKEYNAYVRVREYFTTRRFLLGTLYTEGFVRSTPLLFAPMDLLKAVNRKIFETDPIKVPLGKVRRHENLMMIIADVQKTMGVDVRPFYRDLRGLEGWINQEFLGYRDLKQDEYLRKILPKILAREKFEQ